MPGYIIPIKVIKKSHEPSNHDFVTVPPFDECFQQPLPLKVEEGGKDGLGNVGLKGLSVSSVQLF